MDKTRNYERALEQIVELAASRFSFVDALYDWERVFDRCVEIAEGSLGAAGVQRVRMQVQNREEGLQRRLPRVGTIVDVSGLPVRIERYDGHLVWYQMRQFATDEVIWGKERSMDVRQFASFWGKAKDQQQTQEAGNE